MKKISRTAIAFALTTALGSTAALAQSMSHPSFTGFGLGANVSYVRNTVDVSSFSSDLGKDSNEAALIASYGFAMGKDWVGTVGLSLGLMDSDYGSANAAGSTAKAKQQMALSFAPGYRIGNDGLLYGKLAFHQMDVSYTNNFGFNRTKTHQGTGYGIGYAHTLAPSLELSVEYEVIDFDSQRISSFETAKPKQGNLNLGLAYRF